MSSNWAIYLLPLKTGSFILHTTELPMTLVILGIMPIVSHSCLFYVGVIYKIMEFVFLGELPRTAPQIHKMSAFIIKIKILGKSNEWFCLGLALQSTFRLNMMLTLLLIARTTFGVKTPYFLWLKWRTSSLPHLFPFLFVSSIYPTL